MFALRWQRGSTRAMAVRAWIKRGVRQAQFSGLCGLEKSSRTLIRCHAGGDGGADQQEQVREEVCAGREDVCEKVSA